MADLISVAVASKTFFHIMISFAFFIGIILAVAPGAFDSLNQAMQKEYGIKKRIAPQLEDPSFDTDKYIMRVRVIVGPTIAIVSFLLLLFAKYI